MLKKFRNWLSSWIGISRDSAELLVLRSFYNEFEGLRESVCDEVAEYDTKAISSVIRHAKAVAPTSARLADQEVDILQTALKHRTMRMRMLQEQTAELIDANRLMLQEFALATQSKHAAFTVLDEMSEACITGILRCYAIKPRCSEEETLEVAGEIENMESAVTAAHELIVSEGSTHKVEQISSELV